MVTHTILIGASRAQKLPALVCESSILSRATLEHPLKIIHTYDEVAPEPRKPENKSRTGFSFQRFTLPKRIGYEGHGLYLDSDMIVLADVAGLFVPVSRLAAGGHPLLCTNNLPAVVTMECSFVHWDVQKIMDALDEGNYSYRQLMDLDPFFPTRSIPDEWNCLDEAPEGVKLVHYTDMSRQCWRAKDCRPVSMLWLAELRHALDTGHIPISVVREEVRLGHVIPEVLEYLYKRVS